MAVDVSEHPADALALPVELAGGPSVDVWAPTATLLPSLDDDPPGEHRRVTAWRAWHTAGQAWNTAHHLPAEHWHNLLTPALRYVVTPTGREYVRAGMAAPWQVWRLTRQASDLLKYVCRTARELRFRLRICRRKSLILG